MKMKTPSAVLLFVILVSPLWAGVSVPLTVQEAVYPGSVTGVNRTTDPVTVGIPLPDDPVTGVSDASQLTLSGANVGQFRVLGRWPSGRIKWVLVDTQASLSAGQKNTAITLKDGGTGNFGGANLATDNGSTITINTGAATFTINKANFNGIDQAVVGGTTVVASGASQGLVLMGPAPGQTTCPPCTTVYASSNDASSTAVIEENGPAKAVIKATGVHKDASGNEYMGFTVRLYFYKGKAYAKMTSVLRNANYGASNTFATAYKGLQSYELRISPSVSGSTNYTFGNHTGTPTSGTMGASDSAYLYQGQSQLMKNADLPVPYTADTGYSIVNNGSTVISGNATQYPQGWADVSDSNGAGVEIGIYQMAAYWPKSLEFNTGGSDVRVGIWPRQNSQPVYMSWPTWSVHDLFLNFHAANSSSPANDFLKFQHYLIARADRTHYNNAGVFFYNLIDPGEETNSYNSIIAAGTPSVTQYYPSFSISDSGLTDTYHYPLKVYRMFLWSAGGGGNQMEFHLSHLFNFIRRGFTGSFLDASHFYRMVAEKGFPFLDGDSWRNHSADLDTQAFPGQTSLNSSLGFRDWADEEHKHWYGMPDYYFMSGDETIRDGILAGPKDRFASANPGINPNRGSLWNSRAVGSELMGASRLYLFLSAIGDPDAAAVLAQAQNAYNLQVKPDLCVSGYPSGCSVGGTGVNGDWTTKGTSRVRGVHYPWIESDSICNSTNYYRIATAFQASILLQGLWELRLVSGPNWAEYNNLLDLAYGISTWALTEDYADDGSGSWRTSGFRYYLGLDTPNACDSRYSPSPRETVWFPFFIQHAYKGTIADWQQKFNIAVQTDAANGGTDEFGHFTIAAVLDKINRPGNATWVDVPVNVATNGGGSYTLSWTVPAGAQSYTIKTGPKRIVNWIGFDAGTNQFTGDPVNTMAWFGATTVANPPAPSAAGSTQQFTASGLASTGQFFALKALVSGSSSPTGPSVSFNAPANGATISGTVTLSANASSGQGITGVQFQVDGSNIGSSVTGSGPSYSTSWNAASVGNGTHTLSAVATDTTGATGNAGISVTVSNASAAPAISGVTASGITQSGATIVWSTDVGSDSRVNYGVTTAYGSSTPLNSSLVTSHSLTLTGLSAATTYHYQVASASSAGTPVTSSDFTFTTAAAATGDNTQLPTGAWTKMPTNGFPVQTVGWEKLMYSPTTGKIVMLSDYHSNWQEPNRAMMSYDFDHNRWDILDIGGRWHNEHIPAGGHQVGQSAWDSTEGAYVFQCCSSGTFQPENPAWTYWFDPVGQVGRSKLTNIKPGSYLMEGTAAYDPVAAKMLLHTGGELMSYTPSTNTWEHLSPTLTAESGESINATTFNNLAMASMRYNSTNGLIYIFGGRLNYGCPGATYYNDLYTYNFSTNTVTLLHTSTGKPSARQKAGFAYDSNHNIFLLYGGTNDSGGDCGGPYNDTWTFDPTTKTWTDISASVGSIGTGYGVFERLEYMPNVNAFVLANMVSSDGSYADGKWTSLATETWMLRLSGSGPNPGNATFTAPSVSNSLNHAATGWANEPAIAADNAGISIAWAETSTPFDQSGESYTPHIFVSKYAGGSWTNLGGSYSSINGTGSGEWYSPASAIINGQTWITYHSREEGMSAKYWDGASWQGGVVATIGDPLRTWTGRSSISGIAATPHIAYIVNDRSAGMGSQSAYVYVKSFSAGTWTLKGSGALNRSSGITLADSISIASDGSNPWVAWTEYTCTNWCTDPSKPQVYVSQWNGSAWAPVGSSLNIDTSNGWAFDATLAFIGTQPYVAWTERTQSGAAKVYVKTYTGGAWTLVGAGTLNKDTNTGWAFRPSLATDGANLYVGWVEQQAIGQRAQVYVSKWDGASWTAVGGSLNVDPVNGSAQRITMAVSNAQPIAAWAEVQMGGTRQIVAKQWNGSAWVAPSGVPAAPPSCDINGDGTVNATDVQAATNQVLGLAPCSTADLHKTGHCTALDLQSVINASLGGACTVR
jgi:hypothetical protein